MKKLDNPVDARKNSKAFQKIFLYILPIMIAFSLLFLDWGGNKAIEKIANAWVIFGMIIYLLVLFKKSCNGAL